MLRIGKVRMREIRTPARDGRPLHTDDMRNDDRQRCSKKHDKQEKKRQGKTLQTRELWPRELVIDSRTDIQKVGAKDKPGDFMAKHPDGRTEAERLKKLSAPTATGRRDLAPTL